MRTLDNWAHRLLDLPKLIECPVMEVIGHDHEPPLLTGPGHISIKSRTEMEFVMHAKARDESQAFDRVLQANNNPYATLDQLRVFATDYEGTKWNCGWVDVRVGDIAESTWRISGEIRMLMTTVSGNRVSPDASVEVIYDSNLNLPPPKLLKRGDPELKKGRAQHSVNVEGVTVEFFKSFDGGRVWGVSGVSSDLIHPYAENWISEPFNLLLGQLVYPRLVARNTGNGSAIVSLRPVPEHTAHTQVSSIFSQKRWADHDQFWNLYSAILTMVIHARDISGERNFEAHPLTNYYQEIAQATTGSNWVLCMTLASVIEGVAMLMFSADERVSDIDPEEIKGLKDHIKKWKGDANLRARILSSLAGAKTKGVVQSLRTLCDSGVLEAEHVKAWQTVRNQVMHGVLVSPWLNAELEEKLKKLIELVHRLSEAYIRKCVQISEGKSARA